MNLLQCPIKSKSSIPFYELLEGSYRGWIPLFLRSEKLKPGIEALEKELRTVETSPLDHPSFLKRLKPHFDQEQQRRVELLAQHLGDYTHPEDQRDPFGDINAFLLHMGLPGPLMPPSFDWREVTEAVKLLPAGMSISERERQSARLTEKLAKLKSELQECCPSERYVWYASKVQADQWAEFLKFWQEIQSRLTAPAGPRGITLQLSSKDERWAWEELGLSAFVNERARMEPSQ